MFNYVLCSYLGEFFVMFSKLGTTLHIFYGIRWVWDSFLEIWCLLNTHNDFQLREVTRERDIQTVSNYLKWDGSRKELKKKLLNFLCVRDINYMVKLCIYAYKSHMSYPSIFKFIACHKRNENFSHWKISKVTNIY